MKYINLEDYDNNYEHTGILDSDVSFDETIEEAQERGWPLFEVRVQDYWNGDGTHLYTFANEQDLAVAIEGFNESDGAFENHWFIEEDDTIIITEFAEAE